MAPTPGPPERAPRSRRAILWLLLLIAILTSAAFAPAIHNAFTDWDDPVYVISNYLVRDLSLSGLEAMVTRYVEGNYHPLTIVSLAIDYHFWKLNPAGYHATNIAIHVANTLAVFWLILLLTGSIELSAVTALFFGVHPMHVESVAWVSGRKDVLYALFYFGSCISYLLWLRGDRRRAIYYAGALALFALSVLSKGMAVTLPLALIAMDFYLGRKLNAKTLLFEKWPFLIVALVFGVVAVLAQESQGAVQALTRYPFHERVLFACYAVSAYVLRALAPLRLSAFYPYPLKTGAGLPVVYWLAPLFVAVLGVAVYWSLRAGRAVAFGAIFFLLNVALVLQLFPVGRAIIADRYTYVSYVGLGFIVASGYRSLIQSTFARKRAVRAGTMVLTAGFCLSLMVAARARTQVWKDNISLWTDVLSQYPSLPLGYAKRAWSHMQRGRNDLAMSDIQRALSLDPEDPDALTTRGTLYFMGRDDAKALVDLDEAVRIQPRAAASRNSRGAVLMSLKEYDRAIADFSAAIETKPSFGEAHLNRALALCLKRQYSQAMPDFDASIAYQPGNARAYLWRGEAKFELGDTTRAIEDYDQALQLDSGFGEAYVTRSRVYDLLGRYDEALRDAQHARAAGYHVDDAYRERLQEAAQRKPTAPGSTPR